MQPRVRRRLRRTFTALLLFYGVSGVVLYGVQDRLFFHPIPLPQDHIFTFKSPFREWNIRTGNRNLNVIRFLTPGNPKGLVLYFHGNRDNVEHYAGAVTSFTRNGYEVWMPDYPGFGKTTGRRTEETIYADATLLYQHAMKEYPATEIVIYGRSIGSGVAAYLASIQPCRQLILETPYYSIAALAQHYAPIYPARLLTRYSFPTYEYLQRITVPVTLLHGTADEIIPYRQAKALAASGTARLVTIKGGRHNNLSRYPLFQQTLDSLLR